MITASSLARQPAENRWQHELATAITSGEALIQALGLDEALIGPARAAAAKFRLLVPRSYVSRMRHGDPNDPLLRQVLPVSQELDSVPAYGADPLGERDAIRAPGLLQKYQGRALLITTSACAVHCRYCFRREFPYSEQTSESARFSEALEAIARDTSIEEVFLSGGDPLSLSDARLARLTDAPPFRCRSSAVLPARAGQGHGRRAFRHSRRASSGNCRCAGRVPARISGAASRARSRRRASQSGFGPALPPQSERRRMLMSRAGG